MRNTNNKRALYESIMRRVSKVVKNSLNENLRDEFSKDVTDKVDLFKAKVNMKMDVPEDENLYVSYPIMIATEIMNKSKISEVKQETVIALMLAGTYNAFENYVKNDKELAPLFYKKPSLGRSGIEPCITRNQFINLD